MRRVTLRTSERPNALVQVDQCPREFESKTVSSSRMDSQNSLAVPSGIISNAFSDITSI